MIQKYCAYKICIYLSSKLIEEVEKPIYCIKRFVRKCKIEKSVGSVARKKTYLYTIYRAGQRYFEMSQFSLICLKHLTLLMKI